MNVITSTKELGEASKGGVNTILVSPDLAIVVNFIRQPHWTILFSLLLIVPGAVIAAVGFVLTMVSAYGLMVIGLFTLNGETFPAWQLFSGFCKAGAVLLPVGVIMYLTCKAISVCVYGGGLSAIKRIREGKESALPDECVQLEWHS